MGRSARSRSGGHSEVEHVLATQTLMTTLQEYARERHGKLPIGEAKTSPRYHGKSAQPGTGYVIEYAARPFARSPGRRMTVCNMSIEAGAAPVSSRRTIRLRLLRAGPRAPKRVVGDGGQIGAP